MRVFISADIEGTAFTTCWDETEKGKQGYEAAAAEMTREVRAAVDGALAAGATEIMVNDAHDSGMNIDPAAMPSCVTLIRGWSGSPLGRVDGIDEGFDAAMFVGWHAAAGRCGNPLSHTMSTKVFRITLNGLPCSEFLLYSWACAMKGVPTVLLCGDQTLVNDSAALHPALKTVAVKDGLGGLTRCMSPARAEAEIRAAAEAALRQDLTGACVRLPERFDLAITYKNHKDAVRAGFFPGMTRVDDSTVTMTADSLTEILRAVWFVV